MILNLNLQESLVTLRSVSGLSNEAKSARDATYEICRVRSPLASFQLKLTSCFNYKKTNGSFFIIQIIGLTKSIDSFALESCTVVSSPFQYRQQSNRTGRFFHLKKVNIFCPLLPCKRVIFMISFTTTLFVGELFLYEIYPTS